MLPVDCSSPLLLHLAWSSMPDEADDTIDLRSRRVLWRPVVGTITNPCTVSEIGRNFAKQKTEAWHFLSGETIEMNLLVFQGTTVNVDTRQVDEFRGTIARWYGTWSFAKRWFLVFVVVTCQTTEQVLTFLTVSCWRLAPKCGLQRVQKSLSFFDIHFTLRLHIISKFLPLLRQRQAVIW